MRGSHENYGKGKDRDTITIRLYGERRMHIAALARAKGVSRADVILDIIDAHFPRIIDDVATNQARPRKTRRRNDAHVSGVAEHARTVRGEDRDKVAR